MSNCKSNESWTLARMLWFKITQNWKEYVERSKELNKRYGGKSLEEVVDVLNQSGKKRRFWRYLVRDGMIVKEEANICIRVQTPPRKVKASYLEAFFVYATKKDGRYL